MTEYTPTEPEITAAVAYLSDRALDPADAYRITVACVQVDLKLLDDPSFDGPTQVRLARAALVARERWAEQETKAA